MTAPLVGISVEGAVDPDTAECGIKWSCKCGATGFVGRHETTIEELLNAVADHPHATVPTLADVEHKVAECRTCHESVVWVITEKGKPMPIDPVPVTGPPGFCLTGDTVRDEGKTSPKVRWQAAGPDTPTYPSHFATCPQADQHRRK